MPIRMDFNCVAALISCRDDLESCLGLGIKFKGILMTAALPEEIEARAREYVARHLVKRMILSDRSDAALEYPMRIARCLRNMAAGTVVTTPDIGAVLTGTFFSQRKMKGFTQAAGGGPIVFLKININAVPIRQWGPKLR